MEYASNPQMLRLIAFAVAVAVAFASAFIIGPVGREFMAAFGVPRAGLRRPVRLSRDREFFLQLCRCRC
jgi:hypothetical protein